LKVLHVFASTDQIPNYLSRGEIMGIRVRKPYVIAEKDDHKFVWLGLDEAEAERGILTNQYLIVDGDEGMLIDPGGQYVFERVYRNVTDFVQPENIKAVFFSHQDPDVVGSLIMVSDFFPNAKVYVSSLWTRFLPHLGVMAGLEMVEIPDNGLDIHLGRSTLKAVPAHFLHSPGNFSLYDPKVRVLFSGDIGAAVFPEGVWYLFVDNFKEHARYMEAFHRRYIPTKKAIDLWLKRVSKLDIEIIAPQHGAIFVGKNAEKFLDWLRSIDGVGVDVMNY